MLMLKGQWWDERSQYERSDNVDQSNPYLWPCHLLDWSCSDQRWNVLFPFKSILVPFSGPFSHGATYQQCSVGEGEEKGKINDGYIKEASGLAYSRRSPKVKIYFVVTSLHENWRSHCTEFFKSSPRADCKNQSFMLEGFILVGYFCFYCN